MTGKLARLMLAICSCSAGGSSTLPPLATRDCVQGWWHGPPTECSFMCPGAPECDAGDCQSFDHLGLTADGLSHDGFVTLSLSSRKFSSFGPRDTSAWELRAGGMLVLRDGGTPIETRCSNNRMDLGISTKTRYSTELGSALDRLKDTPSFSSESF